MNYLLCFLACLETAGLVLPLLVLTAITGGLFVAHRLDRGFRTLAGGQAMATVIVSTSLVSMECQMAAWAWLYLGAVVAGAVALGLVRTLNASRLERGALGRFGSLLDLEEEFGVDIIVLDTQRVRAVAFRDRVYLSMGLLERLDDDQLRAVVAHEAYHLGSSSPRMLSSLLALTSLTFWRYSDEHEADAYAARLIGVDALVGALDTLEVRDRSDRAAALRTRA